MSKSLGNYIGINDTPFQKLEKCMKIPDDVLKQYFELTTDLSSEEINKIMEGDIREAHFSLAKEIISMYDDEIDFESAKQKYIEIASGNIPEDILEIKIKENEINICDLLVRVGFANSKSEAKRHILGKGIKIDSILQTDTGKIIEIKTGKVIQFGKNRFVNIIKID